MSVDKNKGGRPSYKRNDKDEGALEALLSIGFPHRQIQLYMQTNIKTLRKHYPDLFDKAPDKEEKTAMVENSLWYNAVVRLNVVAQLAWLRAYKRELYSEQAQKQQPNEFDPNEFLAALARNLPN